MTKLKSSDNPEFSVIVEHIINGLKTSEGLNTNIFKVFSNYWNRGRTFDQKVLNENSDDWERNLVERGLISICISDISTRIMNIHCLIIHSNDEFFLKNPNRVCVMMNLGFLDYQSRRMHYICWNENINGVVEWYKARPSMDVLKSKEMVGNDLEFDILLIYPNKETWEFVQKSCKQNYGVLGEIMHLNNNISIDIESKIYVTRWLIQKLIPFEKLNWASYFLGFIHDRFLVKKYEIKNGYSVPVAKDPANWNNFVFMTLYNEFENSKYNGTLGYILNEEKMFLNFLKRYIAPYYKDLNPDLEITDKNLLLFWKKLTREDLVLEQIKKRKNL